ERPDIWGGLVDLPVCGPEGYDAGTAALVARALAQGVEDQVAVRGRLFGRRLVPDSGPRDGGRRPGRTPGDGAGLVTGGSGRRARRLARWLAGRGESTVVLASRSGAVPDGLDVPVRAEVCDVTEPEAVVALAARLRADGVRVTAVYHLAGVVSGTPLAE